jgi:hypothetical protein
MREKINKLQNIIENDPSKAQKAMDLMKNNLIELAGTTLKQGDFGKYTSINPKTNYVEFRIAGGDDYEEDIQKLQEHGWFIHEFEAVDYKLYERFQHIIINQETSTVTKLITVNDMNSVNFLLETPKI